ncbi:MAG: aminotransferase class IV [Planctomycetes bacterium]|nr:aminotransferase class IV [Planctomycetota bacterium]
MSDYVFALDGTIVDREQAVVPVLDHGFLFGDSIYEVVRTVGGKLFGVAPHLKRLHHSAKALALTLPWSDAQFIDLMRRIHNARGGGESSIRIIVTRGEGELDLHPGSCKAARVIGIAKAIPNWPAEAYTKGCKVVLAHVRRNPKEATDPAIKSGNYLNNVLAIMEAKRANALEAIMLGVTGHVTEATTSNVFMVKRGVLITPDLGEGLLEGVTRGYILKLARKLKIKVQERAVLGKELLAADEVFLSSTTRDIMPIGLIGKKRVKAAPGPVTARMMEAFKGVLTDPANVI